VGGVNEVEKAGGGGGERQQKKSVAKGNEAGRPQQQTTPLTDHFKHTYFGTHEKKNMWEYPYSIALQRSRHKKKALVNFHVLLFYPSVFF